jgi:hypothetical protein
LPAPPFRSPTVQALITPEPATDFIVGCSAGGAYPFDLSGGARLMVAEPDAERARASLASERAE